MFRFTTSLTLTCSGSASSLVTSSITCHCPGGVTWWHQMMGASDCWPLPRCHTMCGQSHQMWRSAWCSTWRGTERRTRPTSSIFANLWKSVFCRSQWEEEFRKRCDIVFLDSLDVSTHLLISIMFPDEVIFTQHVFKNLHPPQELPETFNRNTLAQ